MRRLYQSFGRLYQKQRHAEPRSVNVLRFCKLRGHSQSIHLPRQEYPGQRSYDAMLRGGQHATHHPLSLPYSTGPLIRGPTQATAAASTSSTCGYSATAGGRSTRSRFWMTWRRGRRLFARRGRGLTVKRRRLAAMDSAPADWGRRPCGCGTVIRADSRRASRLFAPPVRANDNTISKSFKCPQCACQNYSCAALSLVIHCLARACKFLLALGTILRHKA